MSEWKSVKLNSSSGWWVGDPDDYDTNRRLHEANQARLDEDEIRINEVFAYVDSIENAFGPGVMRAKVYTNSSSVRGDRWVDVEYSGDDGEWHQLAPVHVSNEQSYISDLEYLKRRLSQIEPGAAWSESFNRFFNI